MHQAVRGMRDLVGADYLCHLKIVDTARDLSRLYGYSPIETPLFETTAVFQKSLGETSDVVGKEMYTFVDRGGESITLRPEGTAAIVRAFLSAGLSQTLPQKFFHYGPMFRYERPQKGRYRQFYQLSVECLGWGDPFTDVECITLAHHILKELHIPATLHLNTLGTTDDRSLYRQHLVRYFKRYEKDLSPDSQVRLQQNPLRILDSKNEKDQEICKNAPRMPLSDESQRFFDSVCQGLTDLAIPFMHDQTLVRGLDYYVHTAFEFKSDALGAQDTVLGGGRYNDLVSHMGGPHIPGIGWAMGVDRAQLLVPESFYTTIPSSLAIIPVEDAQKKDSLLLAQELRSYALTVHVISAYDQLGKRLKAASRLGALWVLVLGEEEVATKKVQVKYFGSDPSIEKVQSVDFENLKQFFLRAKN